MDISPNRTRKVAEFSQKQALELVDVMELLACAGFARGSRTVENLTEDHVARMRKRFTEYTEALKSGDVTAAGAAGADFSTIGIMAGGNRELQRWRVYVAVGGRWGPGSVTPRWRWPCCLSIDRAPAPPSKERGRSTTYAFRMRRSAVAPVPDMPRVQAARVERSEAGP